MLDHYRKVDLTQVLNSQTPAWANTCSFKAHITTDYEESGYRVQHLEMRAGIGTHIDAPAHFIRNGLDMASLPLEQLMVPARVLHFSTTLEAESVITPADILAHEKKHGNIPENHLIIFHTGWSQYWQDSVKYRNEDEKGIVRFPGISLEAAHLLVERNIAGIAIDTLSPESGETQFPVHQLLLGQGKYIVENIANADKLPPVGSYIIALPLKIEEGTESPARVVGLIAS